MFYRRKIILGLLQLTDKKAGKLRLQKLLFLYSQRKKNSEYDFIPYKYGAYSYSANADLIALTKKGIINADETSYFKRDTVDYLSLLQPEDKTLLKKIIATYGEMNTNALVVHTYINFPYYAIKSLVAKKSLTGTQYKGIIDVIPKNMEPTLFTIGYEGISLEKYLNKLIENNIKVLIDVRKNALSMKFGFSKTLLKRFCENSEIKYMHVPEVGIESGKRQKLNSQEDYDILFRNYTDTTLRENIISQKQILKTLAHYKRIALTCFEANIHQCHRLHLSTALKKIDSNIIVKHI